MFTISFFLLGFLSGVDRSGTVLPKDPYNKQSCRLSKDTYKVQIAPIPDSCPPSLTLPSSDGQKISSHRKSFI